MKYFSFLIGLSLILSIQSCNTTTGNEVNETEPVNSLPTAFKDNFYIGTALGAQHIRQENPRAVALIKKEYNAITPENVMKWVNIHPGRDTFNFDLPDQFVAFGQENDMHIVGHTLVWHSQLAPWVSEVKDSAELVQVMQEHIDAVAGRYKGKIHGWDVVNEALNEDGTLRESVFLKTIGKSYLNLAFERAAAADPQAELYYNDYNLCEPAKRAGCVAMIKELQAAGVKIDGVGMQGHFGMTRPSLEEIEKSILAYSDLGVKVMITELDVTVLPAPWEVQGAEISRTAKGNDRMNPYTEGLPDSVAAAHVKRYTDIFKIFLKHQDKITRVTFWGIDDGHSWKNNWPIRGRTDYTLIFDRNQEPKAAYDSIMVLKRNSPVTD